MSKGKKSLNNILKKKYLIIGKKEEENIKFPKFFIYLFLFLERTHFSC